MNRLIRFLVRLYPAMWRQRYKAEFGALLEDVDPTWRTALALNGLAPITLRLLDAPSLPNRPFYPNRVNLLITGLLAGIVIGLTIAFFRRTPKPA